MQVFNAINQERTSVVFIFQGVKFWREDDVFMVERSDATSNVGEQFDFETFRKLLLRLES